MTTEWGDTAENCLLAHLAMRGEDLMESGTLPALLEPRLEPVQGHLGDRSVV